MKLQITKFSMMLLILAPCIHIQAQAKWPEKEIEQVRRLMYSHEKQKAIDKCNQLIKKFPEWAEPYSYRGIIYFNEDKFGEALPYFKQAFNLGATTDADLEFLGITYYYLGKHNESYLKESRDLLARVAKKGYLNLAYYDELGLLYRYFYQKDGGYENWKQVFLALSQLDPAIWNDTLYQLPVTMVNPIDNLPYRFDYGKKEFVVDDEVYASSGFRYDGIYFLKSGNEKFHYLRFYPDGTVVTIFGEETYRPSQVVSWLKQSELENIKVLMKGKISFKSRDEISPINMISGYTATWKQEVSHLSRAVNNNEINATISWGSKEPKSVSGKFAFYPFSTTGCLEGDCVNGIGEYAYSKSGHVYIGEFKDGYRHGWGEYTIDHYYRYTGYWAMGKKNGYAKEVNERSLWGQMEIKNGYWEYDEYCCEDPCDICKNREANRNHISKTGIRFTEGDASAGFVEQQYGSISIIDGGLMTSNVCEQYYYVVVRDANQKSMTSNDPFNDHIYIGDMTLPIQVSVSYKQQCDSEGKQIKAVISVQGDWTISIPIF